jgi:predicted nucleotidyltransferase
MDIKKFAKPINKFTQAIPANLKVKQVIVFGSQARGSASNDSDIDVLVVSDDFSNMGEDERLDVLYRASTFITPEIHPWGTTSQELAQASTLTTLGLARETGVRLK